MRKFNNVYLIAVPEAKDYLEYVNFCKFFLNEKIGKILEFWSENKIKTNGVFIPTKNQLAKYLAKELPLLGFIEIEELSGVDVQNISNSISLQFNEFMNLHDSDELSVVIISNQKTITKILHSLNYGKEANPYDIFLYQRDSDSVVQQIYVNQQTF